MDQHGGMYPAWDFIECLLLLKVLEIEVWHVTHLQYRAIMHRVRGCNVTFETIDHRPGILYMRHCLSVQRRTIRIDEIKCDTVKTWYMVCGHPSHIGNPKHTGGL
jgi:hypothetical protein